LKNFTTQVCIIGAGPGGTATALFLAKKGIPCVLVDKAKFPRDKICGDALSGKVVEVLKKLDASLVDQLSLSPIQIGSWGVVFVAPNGKPLHVPFKKEFSKTQRAPGYISKRIDFDNFLIEQVKKKSSITLIENCELNSFKKENGKFILESKNGETNITADLVIACDGAHSSFAKEIGNIKVEPKHYCAGIRAYFKNVSGIDKDNFIELHFLKEFLPGYFWIFPLPNGEANVGIGMRSDVVSKRKINLKTKLIELIKENPVLKNRFANAEMIDGIKGFGLPLGSKKRKISGDNFMLTGDAASLIDPFTGEGIGNAMMSGMYAAEQATQCISANNFSAEYMKNYDTTVYKRLWKELQLSHRMQKLVEYPWLFNLVVNKANSNKVLADTISCMFEDVDMRDRLKRPGFYFKLIFSG